MPPLVGCQSLVSDTSLALMPTANNTPAISQAVHTSGPLQADASSKLHDINWYPTASFHSSESSRRATTLHSRRPSPIRVSGGSGPLSTARCTTSQTTSTPSRSTRPTPLTYEFLDENIVSLFKAQAGNDITADFESAMSGFNETYRGATQACLDNVFYVGKTDFRDTARCEVQNYLLLGFSVSL